MKNALPARSELLGARADLVYGCLEEALGFAGDIAECGSHEGVTAAILARLATARGTVKTVHVFDSFAGFPDVVTDEEKRASVWPELGPGHYPADLAKVKGILGAIPNVELHPGLFSETFPGFAAPLCFLHSDSDLYVSTMETIELAARTLVPDGIVIFDDYGNPRLPGVQLAVDRWLDRDLFDGHRVPGTIQFKAQRRQ